MKHSVVSLLVGAGVMLSAHDVFSTKITWSREISRLVYKRCASCHRDGGSSFSLTTFEQARPWAKAIKEEVLERRMPPFAAVKGFGDIRDDQALTQDEIHLISDWVEGGSPEGDPALLPKNRNFDAMAPHHSTAGPELIVDGSFTLKHAITISGIRPQSLMEGSSVKVIAARPDGGIEPLIWLYDYKPQFDRSYYFRKPLKLPAGTKIETYPSSAGAVSLLAQN
ncbi:MAG TPA: hypothetical protein VGP62_16590 [Bryobacteraceae bacterium]|nr:hypothetical protein [Bryobacteraceae bacterium]